MAFNRTFPNQFAFKRFSKIELVKFVQQKEKEGWEMVKPIYKETIIDRKFDYSDSKKVSWKFSGDEEVVKYVAVMKKIGA